MQGSISIQQLTRGISQFMHRYHVIIFTVFVLGGLSVATYLIYQATTSAQTPSDQAPANQFDQSTINRIKTLHSASETPTPINLPPGRINPFQE